jgi:hypothetical protein
MKPYKTKTIDDLKKNMITKLIPPDFDNTAYIIYALIYGTFAITFEEYRFEEKIEETKKMILNKGNKISKTMLESYHKTLKDILDGTKKIMKKVDSDRNEISTILWGISSDYERNKEKPGASDIYLKISKEIIDKGVKNMIECEKNLIVYNDYIISIKKNLNN